MNEACHAYTLRCPGSWCRPNNTPPLCMYYSHGLVTPHTGAQDCDADWVTWLIHVYDVTRPYGHATHAGAQDRDADQNTHTHTHTHAHTHTQKHTGAQDRDADQVDSGAAWDLYPPSDHWKGVCTCMRVCERERVHEYTYVYIFMYVEAAWDLYPRSDHWDDVCVYICMYLHVNLCMYISIHIQIWMYVE